MVIGNLSTGLGLPHEPIAKIVAVQCQKSGVLVNGNSETVIRIAPPLIVTDREIAKFMKIFAESVDKVRSK
jgi:acetylornithine aminotransferase